MTSVGSHLASFTIEMAFVTASVQENREKRPELSTEGDGECVCDAGRGDRAGGHQDRSVRHGGQHGQGVWMEDIEGRIPRQISGDTS